MRHGGTNSTLLTPQQLGDNLLNIFREQEKFKTFFNELKRNDFFQNIQSVEALKAEHLLFFRRFDFKKHQSSDKEGLDDNFIQRLQMAGYTYQFYKFSYESRLPEAGSITKSAYEYELQQRFQPIVQKAYDQISQEVKSEIEEPLTDNITQLIDGIQNLSESQKKEITGKWCELRCKIRDNQDLMFLSIYFELVIIVGLSVLGLAFPFVPLVIAGAIVTLIGSASFGFSANRACIAIEECHEVGNQYHAFSQASDGLGKLHSFFTNHNSSSRYNESIDTEVAAPIPSCPFEIEGGNVTTRGVACLN